MPNFAKKECFMKKKVFAVSSLLAALAGCPKDPTPGTEITLRLIPQSGLAGGALKVAFVAYQDGNGAWQRMPGSDGSYRAVVLDERYGVAVGCLPQEFEPGTSPYNTLSIQHLTIDESTEVEDLSCYTATSTRGEVNGTATGLQADERGVIQSGSFDFAQVDSSGAFTLSAEMGTHPLFGLAYVPPAPMTAPVRVVRGADLTIPATGPISVDFSGAVAPVSYPVTWPAGVTDVLGVTSTVRRGAYSIAARMRGPSDGTSYNTVPASMLQAGETIRVTAIAPQDVDSSRLSILYLGAPGPLTVELAEPISPPAPTIPATGRRLAHFEFPAPGSSYPIIDHRFDINTYSDTTSATHYVTLSRGWVGSRAVSYDMPDLSGIPGYVDTLDLQPGEATWTLSRDEVNTREFVAGRKVLTYSKSGWTMP